MLASGTAKTENDVLGRHEESCEGKGQLSFV